MASRSPVKRDDRSGEASVRDLFRTVALTELAIVVPILISGYVLFVAARFLGRFLTPIAGGLPEQSTLVGQALAALPIGATVLLVGLVAHFRAGSREIEERLLVTDDRDDESDETEETAGSETAADEDSETAANADGDPGA